MKAILDLPIAALRLPKTMVEDLSVVGFARIGELTGKPRAPLALRYVPFTELLFEVFSQRYERGATLVTSNLPFDEWTSVFGSERLTGALLDRLTHHVHILEMNGESFRLATSKKAQRRPDQGLKASAKTPAEGDTNIKI